MTASARCLVCWAFGNTQPPNRGVDCAIMDMSETQNLGIRQSRLANKRIMAAGNGYRYATPGVVAVRDAAGQPKSVLAINTDITGRKKTDEALKMQGRVRESMAEGVAVCDEDGLIVFSNAACNAMFGYEGGELLGHRRTPRDGDQRAARQRQHELFPVAVGEDLGELQERAGDAVDIVRDPAGSAVST